MDCSRYLELPLRSEAEARAERAVIADRADLYARMLDYDEARADYVARCSWEQRRGHLLGYLDEQPPCAPLPSAWDKIAAQTLHADVTAAFWERAADKLADWWVVAHDLIDSANNDSDRAVAEADCDTIKRRIRAARSWARRLDDEHLRRLNAADDGRAA